MNKNDIAGKYGEKATFITNKLFLAIANSGGKLVSELIIHIMKNSRLFILYGASKGWYFEWKKRNNKGNERIEENILYMDFKFLDGKIWI